MSDSFLTEYLETCEAAARAGGRVLLEARGRFQSREKARADLITDADLASQEEIRRVIAERYPQHAFVGEEGRNDANAVAQDQITWIVDPLDGTTNFVHGYPHYAVSVAAARGRELLVGAIYDPLSEQCFTAAAGSGAWCGGKRLKTSAVTNAADALVAVSLPAHVARDSRDLLDLIEAIQTCQAVRRSGSAALNLAYVANGSLDAFWAAHIHPWDVAAGVLIVREAGGIVTGRDCTEFDLWNPHFMSAASIPLHNELMGLLTHHSAQ